MELTKWKIDVNDHSWIFNTYTNCSKYANFSRWSTARNGTYSLPFTLDVFLWKNGKEIVINVVIINMIIIKITLSIIIIVSLVNPEILKTDQQNYYKKSHFALLVLYDFYKGGIRTWKKEQLNVLCRHKN